MWTKPRLYYTLFGSAIHETIQAYLVCYYERTIKEADALPLHDILFIV